MGSRVTVEATYAYRHPKAELLRYFRDSGLVTAKFRTIGARRVEILRSDPEGLATLREIPSDVPAVLRRVLGAWNRVVQTERWRSETDGSETCALEIEVVGVPVRVHGQMRIRDADGGSTNHVTLDVSSEVPLIGSKLAEFVAKDVRRNMEADHGYMESRLDEAKASPADQTAGLPDGVE